MFHLRFLRDAPIRRKVICIIMLTTVATLLLARMVLYAYDRHAHRQTMMRDFAVLADMFDDAAAPGLTFRDEEAMQQTLKTLLAHPRIIAAAIFDNAGQLMAKRVRQGRSETFPWPNAWATKSLFHPDRLDTFQTITLAGEDIGTVYLAADLVELNARRSHFALVSMAVLLASVLVALQLSRRLQHFISEPILHLSRLAAQVVAEHNYALRAERSGTDELGDLVDRFNGMLEQIQDRDLALRRTNELLEERVAERTAELERQTLEHQRTADERDRVFQMSPDLLCVVTADGRFRRVNPAFETILAQTPDEIIERSFLELVHPADHGAAVTWLRAWATGTKISDFECRCRHRDGAHRWIAWTASPEPEAGLFYAYGRDLTERRRTEEKLDDARRDLLEASRQAGMAEVATSVLHNVGNVLNSVNVAAESVTGKVRKLRVGNLKAVAALLREHSGDLGAFLTHDPRGRELPAYLVQLAESLGAPQEAILGELERLRENIEHVKQVVATQQSYARRAGVFESVSPADLVEDAIRINSAGLARHEVRVVREFLPTPPLLTDRHRVLQILVNLLSNAKYALDKAPGKRRLVVRVAPLAADSISISVADNGVGIKPEHLERLFQHGFTTKTDGHGFGLHSGALTVKELGGSLTAHSEGEGRGATFTLCLPLTAPTQHAPSGRANLA